MRTFTISPRSLSRLAPVVGLASLAACKSAPPSPDSSPAQPAPLSPPLATIAPVASTAPVASAAPTSDAATPPDGNAFTIDLYRRSLPQKGNALVSGASLRAALGIVYLGARGETAVEMQKAMRLEAGPDATTRSAKAEAAAWESARGATELAIANRLWLDNSFKVDATFLTRAKDGYGASVELVPFKSAAEPARKTINAWVSEKTKKKIPDLLPEGSVSADTRLVVTNAIYFKGHWRTAFAKAQTSNEPFKVEGATPSPVPMMHQKAHFSFAAVDGVKVLDLPYEKSTLAMTVILPGDADGLAKLEAGLDASTLQRWATAQKVEEVRVTLPKFTFRSGGSVKQALQELGMKRAFEGRADLEGIAKDLYVSDVFHKTFVAVDETGTEAAGASGAVVSIKSVAAPAPPPVEFKADHPFLFLIRDTRTGHVLFLGRVTDPKS